MESTGRRMQAVYAVVSKADGKDLFLRVGNAFVNRDGSTTVLLDAVPISGKLHVRDYLPKEAGRSAAHGHGHGSSNGSSHGHGNGHGHEHEHAHGHDLRPSRAELV